MLANQKKKHGENSASQRSTFRNANTVSETFFSVAKLPQDVLAIRRPEFPEHLECQTAMGDRRCLE